MEKEHVYLRNLIDVHLEIGDSFLEEGKEMNAIHRYETTIYIIDQLVKLLKEKDDHED